MWFQTKLPDQERGGFLEAFDAPACSAWYDIFYTTSKAASHHIAISIWKWCQPLYRNHFRMRLELEVSCSTFHGYKSEITYCIEFYFIRVSFNTIKTGVAVLQGTKMLGIKLDEALSSACQRNAPNAAASSNSLNPMTALDFSCQQLQFDIWEKRCAVHSFQKSFWLALPSNIRDQNVDSCHLWTALSPRHLWLCFDSYKYDGIYIDIWYIYIYRVHSSLHGCERLNGDKCLKQCRDQRWWPELSSAWPCLSTVYSILHCCTCTRTRWFPAVTKCWSSPRKTRTHLTRNALGLVSDCQTGNQWETCEM